MCLRPFPEKITSFFSIVEKVVEVWEQKSTIMSFPETSSINEFSPILKRLVLNAEKNLDRLPKQRRHDVLMKNFATSLFIFAGPLSYEFLHQNMPEALPSLRTVHRIVSDEHKTMEEGIFYFDELVHHLNSYESPLVVSIGEDATRLVRRIDYDPETNRLVGFVLLCNEQGLPICDSFLAISFERMEQIFQNNKPAPYAFVYMAQPLQNNVPAFCLACVGSDNKFSAELVLNRWQCIVSECSKRNIAVASFGADGDSREMKAMQISTGLLSSKASPLLSISPTHLLKKNSIPKEWHSWFAVSIPTSVAYVQDIVHVAVKLKSRLIRPSILLPMGNYVAGIHHIRVMYNSFGKDEHGLKEGDFNHRDKQNYDAVLHLTSKSIFTILSQIPDAKATGVYLEIIWCVIDSYLDKELNALDRIELAWYAVFFVRYWRHWLLLKKEYKLSNNFITSNAYMCIELNAHALLLFLTACRDIYSPSTFLPWLLGSQSCERIFRMARSLSSTYSTIINFGMLGFLRRIHKIHIQFRLECESTETKMTYPRAEKNRKKIGHHNEKGEVLLISDDAIATVVKRAQERAKETVEVLGMKDLLVHGNCWENPPTPALKEQDLQDDEFDDDHLQPEAQMDTFLQNEIQCSHTSEEVKASIVKLSEERIISDDVKIGLLNLHSETFQRLSTPLPMFQKIENETTKKEGTQKTQKHCKMVEVNQNGKKFYIHAVWLLQESERVSTDRLFRVRAKQPYSNCSQSKVGSQYHSSLVPIKDNIVEVDDVCVFKPEEDSWIIGKILQFSNLSQKTISSQQYRSRSVDMSNLKALDSIGALCTWYAPLPQSLGSFIMEGCTDQHSFIPLQMYMFTITSECFKEFIGSSDESISITSLKSEEFKLATSHGFTLTKECLEFIENNMSILSSQSTPDIQEITDNVSEPHALKQGLLH